MAKSVNAYDAPTFVVHREDSILGLAAASGTEFYGFFQKCRLRGLHAITQVAGTTTGAASGYTVRYVNLGTATTSIAQLTLSTNVAGIAAHATVTRTINAGDSLSFLKGADGTLVATIQIEWEVLPDAVMS